jgi:hypothetical protein
LLRLDQPVAEFISSFANLACSYRELIKEEKTGEIIHSVEEKLSDHFRHGSDKFPKNLPDGRVEEGDAVAGHSPCPSKIEMSPVFRA